MALKTNGTAHLAGDVEFIQTPRAAAETLSTGKQCGVRVTDVRETRLFHSVDIY